MKNKQLKGEKINMKRENVARQRENWNLREQLNLYSGAALGALTPIAFTRYTIFGDIGYTPWSRIEHPLMEAMAWGYSTIAAVYPFGLAGAIAGLLVGRDSANRLRHERLENIGK